jgi:hypothetical protein
MFFISDFDGVLIYLRTIFQLHTVCCVKWFMNYEMENLYCSPSIIRIIKSRRMRWTGHVARMGKKRNAYKILAGKPEGKRPLGRPRRRWEDNIRMDLRERYDGVVWTRSIWLRIGTSGGPL